MLLNQLILGLFFKIFYLASVGTKLTRLFLDGKSLDKSVESLANRVIFHLDMRRSSDHSKDQLPEKCIIDKIFDGADPVTWKAPQSDSLQNLAIQKIFGEAPQSSPEVEGKVITTLF